MPQLHFSVDDKTAKFLAGQARALGLSMSGYLARIARQQLLDQWPEGYLDEVIGCCAEHPIEEAADLPVDEIDL